jgi:hypothetical protein
MNKNNLYADNLEQECLVFCRYLSGVSPDNFTLKKYHDAHTINAEVYYNQKTFFEKLLITLARIHPLFTQIVDTYAVFLFKNAIIRKKLVLLLAILESCPPNKYNLDNTDQRAKFILFLIMVCKLLTFTLILCFAIVVLLPLHIITDISLKLSHRRDSL